MIIAISGSVGSGKTSISSLLGNDLGFKVVPLNEIAKDFELKKVKSLQTFEFDLDKLLDFVEKEIKKYVQLGEDVIFEGHFAHFIDSKLIDVLFVINRDLKDLKEEYINRKYNDMKINDNLEVESFNLCFYEAIENGYGEEVTQMGDLMKNNESEIAKGRVYAIENNKTEKDVVELIKDKLDKMC